MLIHQYPQATAAQQQQAARSLCSSTGNNASAAADLVDGLGVGHEVEERGRRSADLGQRLERRLLGGRIAQPAGRFRLQSRSAGSCWLYGRATSCAHTLAMDCDS